MISRASGMCRCQKFEALVKLKCSKLLRLESLDVCRQSTQLNLLKTTQLWNILPFLTFLFSILCVFAIGVGQTVTLFYFSDPSMPILSLSFCDQAISLTFFGFCSPVRPQCGDSWRFGTYSLAWLTDGRQITNDKVSPNQRLPPAPTFAQ